MVPARNDVFRRACRDFASFGAASENAARRARGRSRLTRSRRRRSVKIDDPARRLTLRQADQARDDFAVILMISRQPILCNNL
jgi:hypothetical protein